MIGDIDWRHWAGVRRRKFQKLPLPQMLPTKNCVGKLKVSCGVSSVHPVVVDGWLEKIHLRPFKRAWFKWESRLHGKGRMS